LQIQLPEIENGVQHAPLLSSSRSAWLQFNQNLNRDACSLVDERVIEKRIEEVFQLDRDDRRLFWLTLARIAEMAVVQAGAYADACEFQAAGDLLVNPRRIDVHLRGEWHPVVKIRHSRLSSQFKADIGLESPACWLAREATPCITTDAILPWIHRTLAQSGVMAMDYLESINRRMCQVANTISFLMSWQVRDNLELHRRIAARGRKDESFIESNLCGFDIDRFIAMHTEIHNIISRNRCSTRFLDSVCSAVNT